MTKANTEMVHPQAEGFKDKVTPKTPDGIFFMECSGCKGTHYRHAGYMKVLVPFLKPNQEKRVGADDLQVMVCVKCKNCYVWLDGQVYDVTNQIDLNAWEVLEKKAHAATGPGGQC